jgi:hypothetical protein
MIVTGERSLATALFLSPRLMTLEARQASAALFLRPLTRENQEKMQEKGPSGELSERGRPAVR